ncbi:CHAP domain-containing protein [Candidatus Saccharibacteria bacterium]|nr:MAG: CHAP domain-containing protein [Candidatus Saccharibacteria bacterium]
MKIKKSDSQTDNLIKVYKIFLCSAVLAVVLVALFGVLSSLNLADQKTYVSKSEQIKFPDYQPGELNQKQQKIIEVLKTEWKNPGDGPKYAEGVRELWCADFVSWVMRRAGMPFKNPNSGSWRIPGVYTLQEYFSSVGAWRPYGKYQPKTGDIVIYKDDSIFGGHTNFVLLNQDGYLTTIGGNENKKILIQRYKLDDTVGIKGFGELK